MRTLAREAVFKYLYSRLFNPSDEGLFDVLTTNFSLDDKNFAQMLKDTVIKNELIYKDKLSSLALRYKFERIYKADRIAIFIAMAEFDAYKDVTPKIVIIDEACKLSAKYSTENGPDFVNGILANCF